MGKGGEAVSSFHLPKTALPHIAAAAAASLGWEESRASQSE